MAFNFPLGSLFSSTGHVNDNGSHSVVIVVGVSQFEINITVDDLWVDVRLSSPHGTEGTGPVGDSFHRAELLLGVRMSTDELAMHGAVRKAPGPLTVEFPAAQPTTYEGSEENYNLIVRQDCGYMSINFEEAAVMITPHNSLGEEMRDWVLWVDAEGRDLLPAAVGLA